MQNSSLLIPQAKCPRPRYTLGQGLLLALPYAMLSAAFTLSNHNLLEETSVLCRLLASY